MEQETFSQTDTPVQIKGLSDIAARDDDHRGQAELELAGIDYDCLSEVREFIAYQLKAWKINRQETNRIMLSATEILSNLVQHPEEPPKTVYITLTAHKDELIMDIADDSTPFVKFDSCRTKSLRNIDNRSMADSGRGLGIIALQHPEHNYIPAGHSADGFNHFRIWDSPGTETIIAPLPATTDSKTDTDRRHIFVVDDDEQLQQFMKAILQQTYNVTTFGNAADALAAFQQYEPDLIISDLYMPGINGAELRKQLSTLDQGDVTPFVFISGDRDAASNHYITQLGIDDFLVKPVKKQKLLSVVDRLLSRSQQIHDHISGTLGQDITNVLKPELPEKIGPWNISLENAMADAGGGDFVLHHETEHGTLILLADVMGHGIGAKFFAYAYAGYLRSLFRTLTHLENPALFLSALSDAVRDDAFLEARIMTCLGLWLTPDGTATIASAGHPSPGHITAESAEQIPIAGPLPGLSEQNLYVTTSVTLTPGDRLLLFTDGLIEFSASHKENLSDLLSRAHDMYGTDCNEAGKHLWKNFLSRIETPIPEDDATLILLEYTKE